MKFSVPKLCCGMFALLLAVSAQPIGAIGCMYCFFHANLRVEPEVPRAGAQFQVLGDADFCYSFPDAPPLAIEREGSVIRVVVAIVGSVSCNHLPHTRTWTVGPFPAGDYTLELYGFDELYDPDNRIFVESIPLQIAPLPAVPKPAVIPAMHTFTATIMAALLALVGWVAVRGRAKA